jgi:type II secretory pathway pseudopilin PulG
MQQLQSNFAIIQQRRRPSRGMVVVVMVVFIALSLTLFGLWAQSIVRGRDRLSMQMYRIQAERLAEAGLDRAEAQRASYPTYSEETWSVPAADLDSTHAAQVRIHVTALPNNGGLRYEATAEFPTGQVRKAQKTKKIEIPNSGTVNQP